MQKKTSCGGGKIFNACIFVGTLGPVLHERQARSHYDFRSHDFRVWGFRVSGLCDHEGDNNNGDLDDADATCQDPHDTDSIFETDNTVSAGTLDFFQEKVKSMDVHIYSTWPTLWSRSPHPICSGDVLKHGTEAVNKLFEV